MVTPTINDSTGTTPVDIPGLDNGALGPSDSSDSGSDVAPGMRGRDSDSTGTGERAGVEPLELEEKPAELDADHIVGEDEAGLAHTRPDPVRNEGE